MTVPPPRGIAIYDLDRTITRWPTWTPFLLTAIAVRAPWRIALLPIALGGAAANGLGLLDRGALKRLMHRLAIGTLDAGTADALAERFARRFARYVRADARTRIAADRADGYRIVVATAAYDFYAAAIARSVGAESVIATRARRDADGRILPLIAGRNCHGAEKLARIRDWLREEQLAGMPVRFYSDDIADLPTLAWCDEPFAVAPHRPLRAVARARGWPVLDWR